MGLNSGFKGLMQLPVQYYNINLVTLRALSLKCSAMRTLTTDNTYRRLGWSYGIFSGNRWCAAFTSHEMKLPALTYCL